MGHPHQDISRLQQQTTTNEAASLELLRQLQVQITELKHQLVAKERLLMAAIQGSSKRVTDLEDKFDDRFTRLEARVTKLEGKVIF